MHTGVPRSLDRRATRLGRAFATTAAVLALAATAASPMSATASPSGGVAPSSDRAASQSNGKSKSSAQNKSSAKSKSKTKSRKPKRKTARAQRTPTFVSDYVGQTGAIFHRRHRVAGPRGAAPSIYEEEGWFEIDGGRRARTVGVVSMLDAAGSVLSTSTVDDWSTPDFQVHLQLGTKYPGAPGSYGRAGCPTQREAFRRTHGDLALWEYDRVRRIYDRYLGGEQLPAGPVIDGHETIAGEIRRSADFSQTLYLDRATGALRRIVNHDRMNGDVTIDYLAWEMIPAGGSAANLSGVLPTSGLEIRLPEDCEQIAPFPADTP